jgi:hypothetical protein
MMRAFQFVGGGKGEDLIGFRNLVIEPQYVERDPCPALQVCTMMRTQHATIHELCSVAAWGRGCVVVESSQQVDGRE